MAAEALSQVRGTVQADILKEDQAQNTCIFSTEFALRLMGDVQSYFIDHEVRNFYSVSISGYHIAEAGANPITQLAFTLANGFTYVEYYLSRGMDINALWSQPQLLLLQRHRSGVRGDRPRGPAHLGQGHATRSTVQTSGPKSSSTTSRPVAAPCTRKKSTSTISARRCRPCTPSTTTATPCTPTPLTRPSPHRPRAASGGPSPFSSSSTGSLGLAKNENPLQGAFIIEELTDLVEEAVMVEFDRLTERGGVLGAMETMYQRSRIQEESLHYETLKHTGEYPIIGVNTFLSKEGSPTIVPGEVIRATPEEKQGQIDGLAALHSAHGDRTEAALENVRRIAVEHGNLFAELMEAVKSCSLGQLTEAMFEVGGAYRRNM